MSRRKKSDPKTIEIEVLPIGNEKKTFTLEEGAIVEDAIEAYGLDTEQAEVRCNGEMLEMDDEVNDGDRLIVLTSGKVKGGGEEEDEEEETE